MDPVAAIYEAVEEQEAFTCLPDVLAKAAGARSAIVELMTPEWSIVEAQYNYFSEESADYYIRNQLYRRGPWRQAALRPENMNRIVSFEDEVPLERFVETSYFHESIRCWGDDTVHALGGVAGIPNAYVKVAMHRGWGAKPFSAEDAARMQPILPHLRRMFMLRARLTDATATLRLTEAALNAQGDAVFVVDPAGRLQLVNAEGEAMLARQDGLIATRVGLRARGEAQSQALTDAIALACARHGAQGGALALPRPAGPPLRVLIAPLRAGHQTHALVVVNDTARPGAAIVESLRRLYGLSLAEAEIAAALAAGLSPTEVAETRAVSMATVRSQIRQLLQKTEARGIPELVAFVASLPKIGGPRPS